MSKKEKIENIKNVSEFYQALRNEVANRFNSYERCGIFDGWTENQKKECFGFGTHILSNVWLPIQKHYTNKERKKYQKIENGYEDICKRQNQQIAELQKQLAEKDKAIENWQTIYESVVQTCHNDKEEIERLNKRLETQENTITNLVEDNRASQEWYKKQLKEKDKEIEYQESMKILAVENQNKKAIEQLEKVKSAFGLINSKLDKVETIKEYIHYIDHQINELKGKVE